MTHPTSAPPEGELARIIDEQLELAAAKLGALDQARVHPSPVDHEERKAAHANFEDLMLGNAEPTPEMLDELRALESAGELSEDELARQALGAGAVAQDLAASKPPKP